MLGLIVIEEAPQLSGAGEIEVVVASTVPERALHGVSAAPLSARMPAGRGDSGGRAGEGRSGRDADSCGAALAGDQIQGTRANETPRVGAQNTSETGD